MKNFNAGLFNFIIYQLCFYKIDCFIPKTSFWYQTLGGASGTAHDQQTKLTLRYLAAEWFNSNPRPNSNWINIDKTSIKPPETEFMFKSYYGERGYKYIECYKSAVNDIAKANAATDSDSSTKDDPAYHFDAEKFRDANKNVFDLRSLIIKQIIEEKYDIARITLGRALHIIQDFYSHSNWLELGNEDIYEGIGDYDLTFTTTSGETCRDCERSDYLILPDLSIYTCVNNIIAKDEHLTSGYYSGQRDANSLNVLKPTGKCSHGGMLDQTRYTSPAGGINKDSNSKIWSPHYYLHDYAVKLAIKASRQFVNKIRQIVNDVNFGRLLCLTSQVSLAIVMDTTGSMGPYIEAAKERSFQIIDNTLGDEKPDNYILVPFNDPSYGPLFKTEDPNQFKIKIDSLRADGGGDTPEMCFSGIRLAVEAVLPGTSIFVFTDAPAKDYSLYNNIVITALTKRIKIFFLLGDSITGRKRRSVSGILQDYISMSELTGGQVFLTSSSKNDIYVTTAVINALIKSSTVTILKKTDINVLGLTSSNVTFNVDSTSTSFTVILEGAVSYVDILIYSTNSNTKTNITMSSTDLVKNALVSFPTRGTWILQLKNTKSYYNAVFNIRISSTSNYDADCTFFFYDLASNHQGMQEINGNPIGGANLSVQCTSSSTNFFLSALSFINSSNDNLVVNIPLQKESETENEYIGLVTIPMFPFFIKIDGTEVSSSITIGRIKPAIVTPSYILLSAKPINGSFNIKQGQYLQIGQTVTNLGSSNWFQLSASSSTPSVLVSLSQTKIYLGKNAQVNLTITCFAAENATEGRAVSIQLVAQTNSGDNRNFLKLLLIVLSKVPDITPPECKILSDTFLTSCSGINVSQCSLSAWSAAVQFADFQSGVMYVATKVSLANNTLKYYPDLKINPKSVWNITWKESTSTPSQRYNATMTVICCVENSDLIPIDNAGLNATCTVGKPPPPPDEPATSSSTTIKSTTNNAIIGQTSSNIVISFSLVLLLIAQDYKFAM